MENITLFLCDIYGTYKRSNEVVSDKEIKELLDNLEKLRINNNSEKILFSFISTENEIVVKKESDNLKLNNNYKNIKLGIHFFENGCFDNKETYFNNIRGKIAQILFYLEHLGKNYKIDKIYFADDSNIYHDMLTDILEDTPLKDKIKSIVPTTSKGLEELNAIISDIVEEKKIVKS